MLIQDQDYVLLKDGRLLTVHGDCHPPGHLVGEISFVPCVNGDYTFFRTGYRKAYVTGGRGMAERDRERARWETGTCFDHAHPFSTKSLVPLTEVERHLSAAVDPRSETVPGSFLHRYTEAHMRELRHLLGDALLDAPLGLTGSARLLLQECSVRSLHDFDILFIGGPETVRTIARRLAAYGKARPEARLREHGKGWRIRLRTGAGILCPFFRYPEPSDSPLAGLTSVQTMIRDVTVRGRVIDDLHGAYLPTLIKVSPEWASEPLPVEASQHLLVLISHMRHRGDFLPGDRGTFTGELCHLSAHGGDLVTLSVVDGSDSRMDSSLWAAL
ncbi:hypothetical protein [Actinomadura luteofluorescens]